MTISTQDCKDFILSISSIIQADVNDKWKRTKKYKDNTLTLRDFENQSGRTLTIAENNGQLFLYKLSPLVNLCHSNNHKEIYIPGQQSLEQIASDKDVFNFMAHCVKENPEIVDNDSQTISDAINPNSWTIWEKWSQLTKKSNHYDNHPLEDFFNNFDGSWGEFDLYYPDKDGNILEIEKKDIFQIFWVGMSDYDTAYRIYVFETHDHQLWLGCNNPD